MKTKNYIKSNCTSEPKINRAEVLTTLIGIITVHKKMILILLLCILVLPAFILIANCKNSGKFSLDDNEIAALANMPLAASMTSKSVITIPSGVAKSNPFVPYREVTKARTSKANDLPAFNLVEPPEMVNENSDAARVMDTIVSGILYDKFSPSAILNIEGNDYLVKKGDVVNNYKVLDILQDSVTVKLGANTYKAGIGEILTEGEVNRNTVSNLGSKFGGAR